MLDHYRNASVVIWTTTPWTIPGNRAISYNPEIDYGPTRINRPHVFVSNLVYDVPSFTGHNALVRHALGGWELAGILQYASGPSLSIFGLNGGANGAPGGLQGTGYNPNQKPNQILSDCRAHGGPKYQWFNPAAFTLDNYALGTFGDSHVGACSGPGIANTDFSVYKNFKVTERVTLQFRMEFYNLFNTVQFRADNVQNQLATNAQACSPSVTLAVCQGHATNTVGWSYAGNGLDPSDPNYIQAYGQGNFGQAGALGVGDRGPREIQYALKINF
jgi:hypothetical protein